MLLDKPLRLTHGAGNGIDTACLMTAANMLIGKGAMGDDCECVCPVLRAFIIPTNDAMPLDLLAELYGPLAWEIIGTRTDDIGVMVRRAEILAAAANELARYAAKSAKSASKYARYVAKYAKSAAMYAEYAGFAAHAADAAAYAATHAAAYAANDTESRRIWTLCRDVIRAAAAIGDRRPIECAITTKQLCDSLSK